MSDRCWMSSLTEEQRAALAWRCVWCGVKHWPVPSRICTAPDGDGHLYEPVKPADFKEK